MNSCIKAVLFVITLSVAGCGEVDKVQIPDEPDPMPKQGPTSEGLEEQSASPT